MIFPSVDENGRMVLESADFPSLFLGLLGSGNPDISQACITLLLKLTESPTVRQRVITAFDNERYSTSKILPNSGHTALLTETSTVRQRVIQHFISYERYLGCGNPDISQACITLLLKLTENPTVRQRVIAAFNNERYNTSTILPNSGHAIIIIHNIYIALNTMFLSAFIKKG